MKLRRAQKALSQPLTIRFGTSYSASFYMHVRLVVILEPSVLELAITDRVEVTSQFDQSLATFRRKMCFEEKLADRRL